MVFVYVGLLQVNFLLSRVGMDWGEDKPKEGGEIVFTELIKDIESRAEFGLKKYGQHLMTNDGRSTLKDAYEEAVDLCMYLKKKLMEEKDG